MGLGAYLLTTYGYFTTMRKSVYFDQVRHRIYVYYKARIGYI